VLVISTATNTLTAVIPLPSPATLPERMAFSPNGRLAMTNGGFIMDVPTDTLLRRIPVDRSFGRDFTFSADSTGVYVVDTCAGNLQGALQHFDVATGALLRTLLVGRHPMLLAPTPDRMHLYVVTDGGRNLAEVDTAAWTVEDEFGGTNPASARIFGLEVSNTAPLTQPGTRFGLGAPFRHVCGP
jgi:DNA-binding beta-propeller fold protein YncE